MSYQQQRVEAVAVSEQDVTRGERVDVVRGWFEVIQEAEEVKLASEVGHFQLSSWIRTNTDLTRLE